MSLPPLSFNCRKGIFSFWFPLFLITMVTDSITHSSVIIIIVLRCDISFSWYAIPEFALESWSTQYDLVCQVWTHVVTSSLKPASQKWKTTSYDIPCSKLCIVISHFTNNACQSGINMPLTLSVLGFFTFLTHKMQKTVWFLLLPIYFTPCKTLIFTYFLQNSQYWKG